MNLQYNNDGKEDTSGIEIVKNEPYTKDKETGQYTYKIYHIQSKVPDFIKWAIPEKYLHIHEESWNAYPHYHTVDFVPDLGDDFVLDVETENIKYTKGMTFPENALNLPPEELEKRKIRYIDIVDGIQPKDKKLKMEGFQEPAAGIMTPLRGTKGSYDKHEIPKWVENYTGDMVCCIKVVKFRFHKWGLQAAIESYVTKTFYPKIFTESHQKLIASAKSWYPLTMDQIVEMEKERIDKNNPKTA